ncbi:MAG: DUF3592 domain-containing protein [Pseudomonadota bacterium]
MILSGLTRCAGGVPRRWLGPILLGIGLAGMFYTPLVRVPLEHAFETRGIETTARVVELFKVERKIWQRTRRARRGAGPWRARLEYKTRQGHAIRFVEKVNADFYTRASIGTEVRMTYLPEKPETRVVKLGNKVSATTNFYVLSVIALGGLCATLIWPPKLLK